MKRIIAIVIALVGFVAIGLLFWRQPQRLPATSNATPGQPKVSAPMDAFQSGVKPGAPMGAAPDSEAKRQLMRRLQREEEKQKPAEGRN